MTLGERIYSLRKARGLSQEELAAAVGVSRQAVSKWELGESQPEVDKVVLLAQALGVTTDQLLLGVEPPKEAAPVSPAPTTPDRMGAFARFLKKHGYKAGYLLIAYGALMLLVAGVMFLMVHGFFSASTADPFGLGVPGFFSGIQSVFYIVPVIPAVIGAALVITGIVVIVRFKHKGQ